MQQVDIARALLFDDDEDEDLRKRRGQREGEDVRVEVRVKRGNAAIALHIYSRQEAGDEGWAGNESDMKTQDGLRRNDGLGFGSKAKQGTQRAGLSNKARRGQVLAYRIGVPRRAFDSTSTLRGF